MMFIFSQLIIFGCLFQTAATTDPNLEEPFLLPFGPKHGDTFTTKELDYCSTEQDWDSSVRFGSEKYESVFVCTNGLLSFGQPFSLYNPPPFNTLPSNVLIAPFWADVQLYDNLLDQMCLYTDTYLSSEIYFYHQPEAICSNYKDVNLDSFQQDLNYRDFVDENLGNLVDEWSNQNFSRKNFNINTDDDLTRTLMGAETTKYVNLGNNVFKRQISEEGDLEKVSDLITTCTGSNVGFHATWGYVASWYKVGMFDRRLDGFNSYQTIITCDDRHTSLDSDDKCFVIFDFYELQWTINDPTWMMSQARSGLIASDGFYYELPSSGTAEVRNLWAESNCNIRGIWVFELDQTGTRDAILLPNVGPPQHKLSDLCSGQPTNRYPKAFLSNQPFVVPNCGLPDHNELNVKFTGANCQKIKPVSFDENEKKIRGYYPDNWGITEEVYVSLILDGIEVQGYWNVQFASAKSSTSALTQSEMSLVLSDTPGKVAISLVSDWADGTPLEVQSFTNMGSDQGCPNTKTSKFIVDGDRTTFDLSLDKDGLSTVFSLSKQSTDITLWTPTVVGESNLTCEAWLTTDSKRDLTKCTKNLEKWFGCPRKTSVGRFTFDATDAWFAHEEVRAGLSGWEYDICCNQNDTKTRNELNNLGYCSNTHCEFNPGAHFCIRSPRLACLENEDVIYVTNKCCYDSKDVISDPHKGAGSLNMEVNAIYNLEPYYRMDIEPYKACCVESKEASCESYKSRRSPIIGLYWARNILFGRGDPHFETIDGASYPFNGLGVYTMLETTSGGDTKLQISTRRVGNGTVISGFVLQNEGKVLEGYINENNSFKVAIDNAVLQLGFLSEYTSNGVFVRESMDQKDFTFEVLDVKLIVKVVVTDNYLNFMVSVPPTFHSRMKGLLGLYDGNVDNDFTTFDGSVLKPNVDFQTLHNEFGESYRLEKDDWLFQNQEIKAAIESDIQRGSPFVASYVVEFASDEEYNNAAMACSNDTACIRDVALTKDFSFATNFKAIEQKVKDSAFFSELSRVNPPNPEIFADMNDESGSSDASCMMPNLLKNSVAAIAVILVFYLG